MRDVFWASLHIQLQTINHLTLNYANIKIANQKI